MGKEGEIRVFDVSNVDENDLLKIYEDFLEPYYKGSRLYSDPSLGKKHNRRYGVTIGNNGIVTDSYKDILILLLLRDKTIFEMYYKKVNL